MRNACLWVGSLVVAGAACGPLTGEEGARDQAADVEVIGPQQTSALTEIMAGGEHRWRDELKLDITYCVDAAFGADRATVVSRVAEATADWSQDVQIAFRYLPDVTDGCASSPAARVHVIPGLSYACTTSTGTTYSYLPLSVCPDGSQPGNLPNSGNLDPATQTGALALVYVSVTAAASELGRVVRHELGHVLGFDHEDASLNCSTNHQVGSQPLTAPDPNSIMLTSSCGMGTPTVLSALDRQGAGILYGHVDSSTTSIPGHAMTKGSWFSSVTPLALGANRSFTSTIAGTGDLDLYIGVGFSPTLTRYTQTSRGVTASETVTVNLPPFPFGQDIFVSVYGYSDGVLQSWTLSSGRLANPLDLVARIGAETGAYDGAQLRPTCARASRSCDSAATLKGRGAMSGGVEPNAPNHAGTTCGDGSAGTYGFDESIDAIRVTSADSGPLRSTAFANVAVDVVAWSTTADRLELFYQSEPGAPWWLMGTKFPATTGRSTVTFPMQLNYGGPVQAVRAVFRYNAASSSACPSDMSVFDDIDDLSFTVASAYAGYAFN